MGDENNAGAEEQQGAENQSEETEQTDTGSAEDENESTEENKDEADDDGENQDDGEEDDDDDVEPAVRKKTAKDYIIERKNKKIEKLKKKKDDDEGSSDSDDEDDDISPEDEKVVDKIIQRKYGDKFAKLDEAEDKGELDKFISENPDFKPYQKKIWKFWQHPSRNHLPIESVAYEVAGKDLLKIGAKRGQQADDKAKKTSSGGGQVRNKGGKIDWSKATDAEVAAHGEEVKRRQA